MAAMSLNMEELRELVTARLQEYPKLTPQAHFVDYLINRGVMMLTLVLPDRFLGSLYTTSQENYVEAKKDYDLPSDLVELRHVFINDVRAQEYPAELIQALESNQYLAPIQAYPVYVRLGTAIRVYPAAASTISNGLKWHYVKPPDEMTGDSDTPDLPVSVHYLIPSAAVEVLSEMMGRPSNEFQTALSRLLGAAEARTQVERQRRPGDPFERPEPPYEPVTPPAD